MRVSRDDYDDERYWDMHVDAMRDAEIEALEEEIERTAEEKVAEAFKSMRLDFLTAQDREYVKSQVSMWMRNIKSDGPDEMPISEDEWEEIQEQSSLDEDERIEHEAMLAQVEFVQAAHRCETVLAASKGETNEEVELAQLELAYRQEAAQDALVAWKNRQAGRSVNVELRDAIKIRVNQLGWTREQFAETAGISLSTVRNLLTSTDPERQWTQPVQRAVEEALGWRRGSFRSILEGGEPTLRPDAPAVGRVTGRSESAGTVAGAQTKPLHLRPEVFDAIETAAIREGRNVNDLLLDAIRVYDKIHGPKV